MKTPVTIWLWLLDIIFDLHDIDIILRHDTVTDQIDILDIRAHDTHSRNVKNVVAGAAKGQIQTVVNNVVFPVCDMILAILFFVKVGTSYFEYRKHGQFEFAAPCILFACLIFCLTAPLYIWSVI